MKRYDDVNGQIIGGEYIQAELIQPSGNPYGSPKYFKTDEEARLWAEETIATLRAETHPVVVKHCGWDKKWELRLR